MTSSKCAFLPIAFAVSTDGAMIKRLLDCGADARAGDLSGDTPMHVAVLHGHAVAIKALYMAGTVQSPIIS